MGEVARAFRSAYRYRRAHLGQGEPLPAVGQTDSGVEGGRVGRGQFLLAPLRNHHQWVFLRDRDAFIREESNVTSGFSRPEIQVQVPVLTESSEKRKAIIGCSGSPSQKRKCMLGWAMWIPTVEKGPCRQEGTKCVQRPVWSPAPSRAELGVSGTAESEHRMQTGGGPELASTPRTPPLSGRDGDGRDLSKTPALPLGLRTSDL